MGRPSPRLDLPKRGAQYGGTGYAGAVLRIHLFPSLSGDTERVFWDGRNSSRPLTLGHGEAGGLLGLPPRVQRGGKEGKTACLRNKATGGSSGPDSAFSSRASQH